jgi:hypothetical protein
MRVAMIPVVGTLTAYSDDEENTRTLMHTLIVFFGIPYSISIQTQILTSINKKGLNECHYTFQKRAIVSPSTVKTIFLSFQ